MIVTRALLLVVVYEAGLSVAIFSINHGAPSVSPSQIMPGDVYMLMSGNWIPMLAMAAVYLLDIRKEVSGGS